MTSEAAWRVEVAEIVGVRPSIHFHIRKDCRPIDLLKIGTCILDRGFASREHIGILGPTETLDVFGYSCESLVGRVVAFGERRNTLLLDKR